MSTIRKLSRNALLGNRAAELNKIFKQARRVLMNDNIRYLLVILFRDTFPRFQCRAIQSVAMMDAYMRFRAVLCKTAKIRLKSPWLLEGLWCGQTLGLLCAAMPCSATMARRYLPHRQMRSSGQRPARSRGLRPLTPRVSLSYHSGIF